MARPGISIALCTCNGGNYLRDQLESILAQTQLPEEVVIGDDCSTDDTMTLVERFGARAPFHVSVRRNPSRLGVAKNFEQTAARCQSELIAFCDQDDVWLPHKLQRLAALFTSRPEILMAFSDASLVDDKMRALHRTLSRSTGFSDGEREEIRQGTAVGVLARHNVVCGATMIWRSSLRERVFPIGEGWLHDYWVAIVAACCGRVAYEEEPLILYRQHGAQQIGGGSKPFLSRLSRIRRTENAYFRDGCLRWRCLAERLRPMGTSICGNGIRKIEEKAQHLHFRATLRFRKWRLGRALAKEVLSGAYHAYSEGWPSVAADLLAAGSNTRRVPVTDGPASKGGRHG